MLSREYGEYVAPVEPGYDFSVAVDLEDLPAEKGGINSSSPGDSEAKMINRSSRCFGAKVRALEA